MDTRTHSIPFSWHQPAARLQRLVNAGWFWHYFSRMMLGALSFTALVFWLLRVQRVPAMPALILGAGAVLVAGLWSSALAAGKRAGMPAVLDRLDTGWNLDSRLVSAWRGQGEWPDLPEERKLPVQVRPVPILAPLALGFGSVLLALMLPLPPQGVPSLPDRLEPPDWQAMESLADQLEQDELVEPEVPQAVKKELDRLREKPMEEWYDPATLEATDRLKDRMRMDVMRLSRSLENTSALLRIADQGRDRLTPTQQEAMQDFLEKMRNQLNKEGMKLPADLAQQLQELDLGQLQELDPRALQELEQQLAQHAEGLQQAWGEAGLEGMQPGMQPGQGGVNQGGGASDLTLKDFETLAEPVVPLALDPGNLENARMGDLLKIREIEHEDSREEVTQEGGRLDQTGGSGEVVWEQDLLPGEQAVLQDFFK